MSGIHASVEERHPLPESLPEEVGIPSAAISGFINRLQAQRLPMHSMMIIRHGRVAAEGYWKPFTKAFKHRMYSVSKSFVALAIGLLEAEGKLSLSDRVVDFFPDKLPESGVHPYTAQMTVRDLLMMASGHASTCYKRCDEPDWLRAFFIVPPTHLPGTVFSYDTSATVTLTAIIEKLSGASFLDYMRPHALDAIGFSADAYCLTTPAQLDNRPDGVSHGGSAVICTTRDLAKVALLVMRQGRWGDRQLLPAAFVQAAVSRQIDTSNQSAPTLVDDRQGYGYQIWRLRNNGFCFKGMGGQLAICLPDQDLLVVTTGDTQSIAGGGYQVVFDAVWEELMPHLQDEALIVNEVNADQLRQTLDGLTLLLPEGDTDSPMRTHIDKQRYTFDANLLGLRALSLQFHDHKVTLELEKTDGNHRFCFGFGHTLPQIFPMYGYDCLASAAWSDPHQLQLEVMVVDEVFAHVRMTLCFKADTVTIAMNRFAENFLNEYAGIASGVRE